MFARIPLPEALSRTVVGWRLSERELVLHFKGDPAELSLQCDVCGRLHWILREQFRGTGTFFVVRCHNCGRSGSLRMEGVVLPPP